ncbi:RagB/SusD family nutrient uptake outer membrane protein [Polaribacter aestuariivivens]|uniref:RagB/SusD family nutrient uptake outer membrane protein n=2 Tax=Polaribacter aestuariivivens TaxID=2304626 RepID=A0A5S3NCE9_9FLAO|nr:RagB/SusD family nutrient uptake outer membrane protein [Polaribacter aestuariivivens]
MTLYFKNNKAIILLLTLFFGLQSCESHLDVVPDNAPTIDNAFTLRNEAEKYLFTCYSYIPKNGDINYNIAMLSGDEVWKNNVAFPNMPSYLIATGNQVAGNPYQNVWDGTRGGGGANNNYDIFDGIRHCNIFIENVSNENNVRDLDASERERWIAEAQFLKAYYHYYLLRMYGPIPIIDKNIPIEASTEELNVFREPFDDCVTYISDLLDQAAEKLPESIQDRTNELGRITKPIALGIKAKLLTMAASPLFNGNPDYAGFVDKKGRQLISTTADPEKWRKAADAALAAIQSAENVGSSLYYFPQNQFNLSDTTLTKLSVRQAVTERWNPEIIWSNPNSGTVALQYYCMVPLSPDYTHTLAQKILSPPLKIAKMFHTRNGVPINEDKTLVFDNDTDLRIGDESHRYNILEGYRTARLNFDREPRFYANLGFDGSTFYKADSPSLSDEDTWVIRSKLNDYSGSNAGVLYNVTGYYLKKLVDWRMSNTTGNPYRTYGWPELRLADLYLLYAEALNEAEGPTADVLRYTDLVRKRAGLEGVATSWTNFSLNPSKYTSKEGMREILHRERLIELAFEGNRFWDLRRWKEAGEELNKPIQAWNFNGITEVEYYQILTLEQQRFVAPRDYLWPISENTLLQNPNLVQNPGW